IRQVDQTKRTKKTPGLELILFSLVVELGFVVITTSFNAADYSAVFEIEENGNVIEKDYHLPTMAGPAGGKEVTADKMSTLFTASEWMQGEDAPRKFNTFVWSLMIGIVMYGLLRLIFRKRVGAFIQPYLKNISPNLLDEVTYRAVAIGFPLFTLGGLIFAAIWAQIAWDRFWGWDPKEVWALITWFFYAAFLHLRLSRG